MRRAVGQDTYFYELLVGMKATITVLIQRIILRNRKAITLQYPHEKRSCPDLPA